MTSLPLTKIYQKFDRSVVADLQATLTAGLEPLQPLLRPGATIALAVGSRGIANIAQVVKITVEFIKGQGADPFIIPAMGSHGGGTAAGQTDVLASYGITSNSMGAPIRATMDTVELTSPDSPARVFMDRYAYEADGVVVINRIKPHPDYQGPYESGLVKMCVIGLGKHAQALEIHSSGIHGMREFIPPVARQILSTGKVLAGIAIVENPYDEIMCVRVLKAAEIMREEPQLLDLARANMPRLPVDQLDVLLVDRLGKNLSGTGLDTKIIGRIKIRGEAEPARPVIKSIVVSDLSHETHGNALGVGLADVITQKLFTKIDLAATYENTVTSTFLERAKIPLIAQNDAQAYTWARRSCGAIPAGQERVIRIQDTLHLGEVYVSDAILADLRQRSDIEFLGEPMEMFDEQGNLYPF